MAHVPVVGVSYSVVCPVCFADVVFVCASTTQCAVRCRACHSRIDLRRPTCTLPDKADDDEDSDDENNKASEHGSDDAAVTTRQSTDDDNDGYNNNYSDDCRRRGVVVHYAADVVRSAGSTAAAQVAVVVAKAQHDAERTLPKVMTYETRQAYIAKRFQAFASQLSFLHVFTYAIERVCFGTRPAARLGHVRIFRKHLPWLGTRYFVVPATSTAYALPCIYTALTMATLLWLSGRVAAVATWWLPWLRLEWALLVVFYVLLFHVVYSDPGFVRPGYVDKAQRATHELTLLEIDTNARESVFDSVNGEVVERRWCSTCEMHRPARAAHCYFCGLCCHDHDHHCTVIGVCVGRRKIELFTLLAFVGASIYVVPMLLVAPSWVVHGDTLVGGAYWVSVVLFLSCLVVASSMLFMTRQLLCNMLTEQTTRERVTRVYAGKRNPFSRGTLGNLRYHFWSRRVEPSIFTDDFVAKCAACDTKRELDSGHTVVCL